MIEKLVTHSGVFHADDVFAAAVLVRLFPEAILVRTRDKEVLQGAVRATSTIVFDVGASFEPLQCNYDHHQRDFDEKRDNGVPYAAFGLIWRGYGIDYLRSVAEAKRLDDERDTLEKLHATVDTTLVQVLDASDCGELPTGIPSRSDADVTLTVFDLALAVADFQPAVGDDANDFDAAFDEAAAWAENVLRRRVRQLILRHRAESEIAACDDGSAVLMLDRPLPWRGDTAPHHEHVVVPDADGSGWLAWCVPIPEDPLVPKKPFPGAWAGLRDDELRAETSVSDATFCHRGCFVAGARTKNGAMALVARASETD